MTDEPRPDDSLLDGDTLLAPGEDDVPGMDPEELEDALAETHRALNDLAEGRKAAELLALNVSVQREIDVRKRLIEELTTLYERTEQLKGSESERRRVQEAWEASEDRYRHLVESSLGLICVHDMDGVLISVNQAAADALGRTPEEGVGTPLSDYIAPSHRHLFPAYLERIKDTGRDEGIMCLLGKDGKEMLWLYRNTVFQEPGGTLHVIGHAQDITKLKQTERSLRESEEKYRLLVEHASDAIFQIDLDGKIVFANRKTDDLFGYEPAEMVGRHFIEFVGQQFRWKALKNAVQLLRRSDDETPESRLELAISRKDGSMRHADLNVSLIHRDASVIGALAVIRDTRGQPEGTRHQRQTPA